MRNRVKNLVIVGAVMAFVMVMAPTNAFAATVTIGGPTAADWVASGTTAGITVGLEAIPANEASHTYTTGPDAVFDAPDRDSIGPSIGAPYGLGVDNTLISNGMPGVTSQPSEIGFYGNAAICGTGTVLDVHCADELRVTLDKPLHGGSATVTFFYGAEQTGETLVVQLYNNGAPVSDTQVGPANNGAYDGTNPGAFTFNLADVDWDEIRFIGDDAGVLDATDFLVEEISGEEVVLPTLDVVKFYDANANGVNDAGEAAIDGWKVNISGVGDAFTPVSQDVTAGDYTVSEYDTVETNWIHTTPTSVDVTVPPDASVEFGNLCLGAGGGKTLGFWSNKNGQAQMNDGGTLAPELTMLSNLNLVKANGSAFNPANYNDFRTWLLDATAKNMSYMLSAQLAAMELNVEAGLVTGSSLVYAPGVPGANALGFISISALMTAANTELGIDGNTPAGDPERVFQEAKKNALDNANNNLNFVQSKPCTFSFAA